MVDVSTKSARIDRRACLAREQLTYVAVMKCLECCADAPERRDILFCSFGGCQPELAASRRLEARDIRGRPSEPRVGGVNRSRYTRPFAMAQYVFLMTPDVNPGRTDWRSVFYSLVCTDVVLLEPYSIMILYYGLYKIPFYLIG